MLFLAFKGRRRGETSHRFIVKMWILKTQWRPLTPDLFSPMTSYAYYRSQVSGQARWLRSSSLPISPPGFHSRTRRIDVPDRYMICMINHLWSIACSRTSVDRESNNISLFEVLEQLTLSGGPIQPGKKGVVPILFEIVSLWTKEHENETIKGRD